MALTLNTGGSCPWEKILSSASPKGVRHFYKGKSKINFSEKLKHQPSGERENLLK
ncbi:hypothetical protein [Mordavella massiliensis]|uniref:hypothetical protein n=1 Tax=Mordavella massiliensis TaxID=1871024 RepID=UPI00210B6429|nr:hypothetical protein [Mordavella massiliensis]